MTFDSNFLHWPTLEAFTQYLATIPRPSWCSAITNHNTYIPNVSQWRGMASLQSMRTTYIAKGWTAGPHLYCAADAPNPADRGIWQMTPLAHIGVHAGPCNSNHLGIEHVGDFDAAPPSPAQYTLMLGINAAFCRAWGIASSSIVVHHECMPGRTCPGRHIDPTRLRADLAQLLMPASPLPNPSPGSAPYSPMSPLLASPAATAAQASAYILRYPTGGYSHQDVADTIIPGYFTTAGALGLDPILAIAQMIHETGNLTSFWSQRPRRNPAGLGVTGAPGVGLAFASWVDAINCHVGRLLAYALPTGQGLPAQTMCIAKALAVRPLPSGYRGTATLLRGLNGRWAVPGTDYADRIAAIANAIVAQRV